MSRTLEVPSVGRLTATLGLTLTLALAACGGSAPGGAASSGAASGGSTPAASASAPGGDASAAPSASTDPAPSTATGGGLSEASDFCLNTPEEVSTVLGVPGVTASGVASPGLGGGCMYLTADGTPVYSISVVTGDAALGAFEGYRSSEGAEDVAGVGDAATFLPLNDLLGIAFRKGDVVASMAPLGNNGLVILEDEAATREALLELARSAAGAI